MSANQKERKPNEKEIKAAIKQLRSLIDRTRNPMQSRIAFAMECAIRWATENTTWDKGSHSQSFSACENAEILQKEIKWWLDSLKAPKT